MHIYLLTETKLPWKASNQGKLLELDYIFLADLGGEDFEMTGF